MKSRKYRYLYKCTFILSFMLSNFVHAAEYIYISDNLRVGVRTEPAISTPSISVVSTGMRLKVEGRTEGYIKITTDKGVTGWIKDIYATKKAPAIIQLNNFRKKYDKLSKERGKDLKTFATLKKANKALNKQINELKLERREWESERINLLADQDEESSWYWPAGVVVLLLFCFIAGALWYRTQAMKRLGGLRV